MRGTGLGCSSCQVLSIKYTDKPDEHFLYHLTIKRDLLELR